MANTLIRLAICIAISLFIFLQYLMKFTNGISDNFYLRLTTPRQTSLILGTSRAAQGIVPEVFNNSDLDFERKLYNFSFTDGQSLFGSVYFNAITRKINPESKHGLYIIEVSPMSISELKINNNSIIKYEETGSFLEIKDVTRRPNLEYIFLYYPKPYYVLLYNQIRNDPNSILRPYVKGFQNYSVVLHDDGWLEVSVPMDSVSINERFYSRIEEHKKYFSLRHFSQFRFSYLKKTIEFLQQHGNVVLVRLPIDKRLFALEDNYMPDFNSLMSQLASDYNIPYYTFKIDYLTTDGNHLYKSDSKVISSEILKRISLNPYIKRY
jgi:hypothetical protein